MNQHKHGNHGDHARPRFLGRIIAAIFNAIQLPRNVSYKNTHIHHEHLYIPSTRQNQKQTNGFRRRLRTHKKNKGIIDIGTVHKSLPPASTSASCTEFYHVSDDVMMQLQVVRDNGRWDTFEDVVVTLSQKYTSHEAQIVILLERSMAACYQNNLEESAKMIKTAIDMSKHVENGGILQGISYHGMGNGMGNCSSYNYFNLIYFFRTGLLLSFGCLPAKESFWKSR